MFQLILDLCFGQGHLGELGIRVHNYRKELEEAAAEIDIALSVLADVVQNRKPTYARRTSYPLRAGSAMIGRTYICQDHCLCAHSSWAQKPTVNG